MSQSWGAYLDELEAALRDLYMGSARVRFPALDDLGPLPDDLRGRAEVLLRAVTVAAGPFRTARAEAASRLGVLAGRPTGGPVLKA